MAILTLKIKPLIVFNLLKKTVKPSYSASEANPVPGFQINPVTPQPDQSVDAAIHREVYSAQELLLEEANRVLNTGEPFTDEISERISALSRLGFGNAAAVAGKSIRQKKYSADLKKRIEYYMQKYPHNKFIDEATVKTICEKYGLLLADAWDYIAEIPEKNQKEIIAFRVRGGDLTDWFRYPHYYRLSNDTPSLLIRQHQKALSDYHKKQEETKDNMVEARDLKIIAPAHKLKTEGKKVRGYRLETKDPIVLQPVEGGYLIVSSWGLEASDELVLNPKHN